LRSRGQENSCFDAWSKITASGTSSIYANDANAAQLVLTNNHNEPRTITAPLSGDQSDTGSLGLDPAATYYLHDFWNDEFLGEIPGNGKITRPLKPQQSLVYALRRKLDHPQAISTNRHIMQDLLDPAAWNPATLTLSGTTRVVAGEPAVITFAGNGYQPITPEKAGMSITRDGDLTKLTLTSDTTTDVAWRLVWKK
jgi:hypothetical protein